MLTRFIASFIIVLGLASTETVAARDPSGTEAVVRAQIRDAAIPRSRDAWLKQARELEQHGDWPHLLELARRWQSADAGEPMAWYAQGRALSELQRPAEAVGAYLQALQLDPENVYALNNLGNAYRQIGRFQEALSAYREALRHLPDLLIAWRNLGVTYYGLKGPAGIAEALQEAERISPDIAAAWRELLDSYARGKDEADALEAVRALGRRDRAELDALFEILIGRLN